MIMERFSSYGKDCWNDVERTIRSALAEHPPVSVTELAKRGGYGKSSLYSRFGKLCREIAAAISNIKKYGLRRHGLSCAAKSGAL